jgi:hypothetical protein
MIRRLLFLGLPLLAAIVAAAAGWWLFVREDNELAEAAPEIPDLRTQTASPPRHPRPARVMAARPHDPGGPFRSCYFAGETRPALRAFYREGRNPPNIRQIPPHTDGVGFRA